MLIFDRKNARAKTSEFAKLNLLRPKTSVTYNNSISKPSSLFFQVEKNRRNANIIFLVRSDDSSDQKCNRLHELRSTQQRRSAETALVQRGVGVAL